MLDDECFDVVYCHLFCTIFDSELEIVLPELPFLKSQGVLVFREPLTDTKIVL